MSGYNYIVNPKTNRKVNINGKLGKEILTKYLYFKGGAYSSKPPTNATAGEEGIGAVITRESEIAEEYYISTVIPLIKDFKGKSINYVDRDTNINIIKYIARTCLRKLKVFTIDPIGCTDADDAFSYEYDDKNNEEHLYIHIADPTHYIDLYSDDWQRMSEQVVTRYFSGNHKPIHLCKQDIVEQCSLQENVKGNEKSAITIKYTFTGGNYSTPNSVTEPFLSTITVSNEFQFTYKQAGGYLESIQIHDQDFVPDTTIGIIKKCQQIAIGLRAKRTNGTTNSRPPVSQLKLGDDNLVHLVQNTKYIQQAHDLIEEFAILTNHTVAKFLYDTGQPTIYRTNEVVSRLFGIERELAENNKPAISTVIPARHAKLNVDYYTHYTSPLRRFSDLMVHYDVKLAILHKYGTQKDFFGPARSQIVENVNLLNRFTGSVNFYTDRLRFYQWISQNLSRNIILYFDYIIENGTYHNLIIRKVICQNDDTEYPINIKYSLGPIGDFETSWKQFRRNGDLYKLNNSVKIERVGISPMINRVQPYRNRRLNMAPSYEFPDLNEKATEILMKDKKPEEMNSSDSPLTLEQIGKLAEYEYKTALNRAEEQMELEQYLAQDKYNIATRIATQIMEGNLHKYRGYVTEAQQSLDEVTNKIVELNQEAFLSFPQSQYKAFLLHQKKIREPILVRSKKLLELTKQRYNEAMRIAYEEMINTNTRIQDNYINALRMADDKRKQTTQRDGEDGERKRRAL